MMLFQIAAALMIAGFVSAISLLAVQQMEWHRKWLNMYDNFLDYTIKMSMAGILLLLFSVV